MSEEFCATCHCNLAENQEHSESCKFLKDAEQQIKNAKHESDIAIKNAKEQFEKQLELEKENITKEARQKILDEIDSEKQKILQLKFKKDKENKNSFIKKIMYFDSEKQVTIQELEEMNLAELIKYYEKIIKIHVADKKMNFKVTCLKCGAKLGQTITEKDAEQLLKLHNKSCPKKSNIGNWIIFALALGILSGVAFTFFKSNPHILKKGKDDAV